MICYTKYTDNEKHHKNIKPERAEGSFSNATNNKIIPKMKISKKPPNIGHSSQIFNQLEFNLIYFKIIILS